MSNWRSSNCVGLANVMVSRMLLLVIFLIVRRSFFMIEQPGSSILNAHARFEWCQELWSELRRRHNSPVMRFMLDKVWTWMGLFGHPNPKGTHLWTNLPCAPEFRRAMSKADQVPYKFNSWVKLLGFNSVIIVDFQKTKPNTLPRINVLQSPA